MNDPHQHTNGGFEHEDLGAKPIFGFLIGLAALGILVYFLLTGMYRVLDNYFETHQAAQNPMKAVSKLNPRDVNTERVRQNIEKTFPEPRLETDERDEINNFRMEEEQYLNSYGWIDQKAGSVHIPIERAMQLVAQRGLPVAPSAGSASPDRARPGAKTGKP